MPRRPAPLPAALGPVFQTAHARALGVTQGRLTAADLERPFRGIRAVRPAPAMASVPGEPPPSRDEIARGRILARVRAHAPLLPPHAFYIGATARALHGLPFTAVDLIDDDLHVGVFAPHRALRRPGVRSIQVRPELAHAIARSDVRVASPASLWAMSARDLTVEDLVVLGDAIVFIPRDDRGRRHPELQLASPAQLRAALDAGRRQGGERLRTALGLVREGSMSPLETDWRLNLRGSDLPEPELDVEVCDARGILLGISDAAFAEHRLAVEIEGDHHRTSRRQWHRDIDKYTAYAAAGWEVVRLTAAHIRPAQGRDVRIVRDALLRRGWHP